MANEIERPRILIIAGPNGAGKTTFAMEYLPNEGACKTFVNADLIAAGLSPFDPDAAAIQAGRIMLERIAELVEARESFAFETTLSGKGYARMIREWRAAGYFVKLVFLRLDHPETAVRRVAARFAAGGHNIPPDVVHRRFLAGLANFEAIYKAVVSEWEYYDNSKRPRELLGVGKNEE